MQRFSPIETDICRHYTEVITLVITIAPHLGLWSFVGPARLQREQLSALWFPRMSHIAPPIRVAMDQDRGSEIPLNRDKCKVAPQQSEPMAHSPTGDECLRTLHITSESLTRSFRRIPNDCQKQITQSSPSYCLRS